LWTARFFSTLGIPKGKLGCMYEIYIMPGASLILHNFPKIVTIGGVGADLGVYFPDMVKTPEGEQKVKEYNEKYDILTALHVLPMIGPSGREYRLAQQSKINPRLISQKGRVVMRLVKDNSEIS
jgi:hypothetical protein